LTAFARVEDRETALRFGFQRHLGKPVDSTALLAACAELLALTQTKEGDAASLHPRAQRPQRTGLRGTAEA
jgi:hypothetical protein